MPLAIRNGKVLMRDVGGTPRAMTGCCCADRGIRLEAHWAQLGIWQHVKYTVNCQNEPQFTISTVDGVSPMPSGTLTGDDPNTHPNGCWLDWTWITNNAHLIVSIKAETAGYAGVNDDEIAAGPAVRIINIHVETFGFSHNASGDFSMASCIPTAVGEPSVAHSTTIGFSYDSDTDTMTIS